MYHNVSNYMLNGQKTQHVKPQTSPAHIVKTCYYMLLYIKFLCAFAVRTTFPKTENAFLQHAKRTNLWNSYGVFMFSWCMAAAKLFKLINLDSAKMAWPKKHHVISLVGGFKVYKLKAAKRAEKNAKQEQKAANDRTLGRSIFACSEFRRMWCNLYHLVTVPRNWLRAHLLCQTNQTFKHF